MSAEVQPSSATVLRQLFLPVYLPVLAVNGGTAMLVPILPLYLRDLGLTFTWVSIIIGAAGIGAMAAQLPIGRLLLRTGESKVMIGSLVVVATTAALTGIIGATIALVCLRLVWGVGSVGWLLSRQTFLTRTVDAKVRGRAMSVFGGTTRLAFLLGPLISGVVANSAGFRTAFLVTGITTLLGLLPLLFWQRRSPLGIADRATRKPSHQASLAPHTKTLAITGAAQICIMVARQGRFVVLPLMGDDLGLGEDEIGALVAAGGFFDLLLFPVAGYLMDRFGRLSAIVPSFTLLGIGLFVLASVQSPAGIAMAAIVIGVGNGLGSGTMLTVSSDLAPIDGPSQFLGALGMIRDSGRIGGPLVVGVLADQAGLSPAAAALGGFALVGTVIFWFGLGETRDRGGDTGPPVRTSLSSPSGA